MPGAKDAARTAMPEIAGISLERELCQGARRARRPCLLRRKLCFILEPLATQLGSHDSAQFTRFMPVLIAGIGKSTGQSQRPVRQRQPPWPREPAPEKERAGPAAGIDLSFCRFQLS